MATNISTIFCARTADIYQCLDCLARWRSVDAAATWPFSRTRETLNFRLDPIQSEHAKNTCIEISK